MHSKELLLIRIGTPEVHYFLFGVAEVHHGETSGAPGPARHCRVGSKFKDDVRVVGEDAECTEHIGGGVS